ncbi:MAG: hypothetical protein SGPRY_011065, partial [Prymnesium sp.]
RGQEGWMNGEGGELLQSEPPAAEFPSEVEGVGGMGGKGEKGGGERAAFMSHVERVRLARALNAQGHVAGLRRGGGTSLLVQLLGEDSEEVRDSRCLKPRSHPYLKLAIMIAITTPIGDIRFTT